MAMMHMKRIDVAALERAADAKHIVRGGVKWKQRNPGATPRSAPSPRREDLGVTASLSADIAA